MDPNDIWAPPHIPAEGEKTRAVLYEAVGAALSEWEHLESILALLFGTMLGLTNVSLAAHRAYGSIVAFSGRLELLKGAASGYFEAHADDAHERAFEHLIRDLKRASPRRNDIAHGTVSLYPRDAPARDTVGYLLMPGSYSTLKNDAMWRPKYAYNATHLNRFKDQFAALAIPTADLFVDMTGKHQAQRAGRIPPSKPKPGSLLDRGGEHRIDPPSEE